MLEYSRVWFILQKFGNGGLTWQKRKGSRKPKGNYAKGLESAVDEVKESEKWRREYMTLFMRDKENQRLGKLEKTVTVIRRGQRKLEQGKLEYEELIDLADTDMATYDKIVHLMNDHPDWDDEDIADEFLEQEES